MLSVYMQVSVRAGSEAPKAFESDFSQIFWYIILNLVPYKPIISCRGKIKNIIRNKSPL